MNLAVAGPLACPSCGEPTPPGANWCEACGADLDGAKASATATRVAEPKHPCVSCGAPAAEVTDDGWCQVCGRKQPRPTDHVVADHGWFTVVSDRGRVHHVNEDAGAVAARPSGVVLVVCDGVSSTDEAQNAAQAAAALVASTVVEARPGAAGEALVEAGHRAQRSIVELTGEVVDAPPSCTLVAVVADISDDRDTAQLTVGWLGDSRAYWLVPADRNRAAGATQLTRDHSWAAEQLELGLADAATIEADPRAHSITRWLGADSHDPAPELATATVELPGVLLVCSDGLWNYAPTEAAMAEVAFAVDDASPLARAERLVAFANERGGHDNITVAIADLTARGARGAPDAESSTRPEQPTPPTDPNPEE